MSYPKFESILLEKDKESPKVTYLTLNRPDKNNAISIGEDQMTGDIKKAMWEINHDDDCNVVIFKGAGRNFCDGFALSMVYRIYGGEKGFQPHQRLRLQTDQEQPYGFPPAILDCNT